MTLRSVARHWFLFGLAAAAALAFLVPEAGLRGGPLRPEITTKAGVAAIFFLQGLAISPAALRAGARRWRLHVVVQLFIFAAFPLTIVLLDAAAGGLLPGELRIGFIFLAILPTTILTSVVFTATAGGNTSAALFNSAFANVSGVVLTPLLAALLLSTRAGLATPFASMLGEIALLLLVPLAAGQTARPLLVRFGQPDPRLASMISSAIILFIVFTAFATSVASGAFIQTGMVATALVALGAAALFIAATAGAAFAGRRLRFDAADRTALIFCGSQKTLAAGAPIAQVLFGQHAGLGLILLPLVIYHAVQLVAGAAMAERIRQRQPAQPPAPPHGRLSAAPP
jgi:solute carrier family 10 (sodium/bile acid cotransporter), member 7